MACQSLQVCSSSLKRKRYYLAPPTPLCLSCASTQLECRTSHKLLAKSCYQCEVHGLDCSLRYGVQEEESPGEEEASIKRRKTGRAKFRLLDGDEGYDGDVEDCE